jgi:hypothetical protein
MFLIDATTAPARLTNVIQAVARIVKDRRVQCFRIALANDSDDELVAAVDILEGQIGAVLSIHRIDGDDEGARLYKSMFEASELGAE